MGMGGGGFIAAMGNFGIQYNLGCASIALSFMTAHPAFAQPAWVDFTLLGLVFAGAVVGMLTLGYLGDLLGRNKAMLFTLSLQVAGALGCAFLTWGDPETLYTVFCVCRFFLGMGVGGMYPLSAVSAREGSGTETVGDASKAVGWAFFWQTPGSMAPYLVAVIILLVTGSYDCVEPQDEAKCATYGVDGGGADGSSGGAGVQCVWTNGTCGWSASSSTTLTNIEWRLLVALGAIPSMIVVLAACGREESREWREGQRMGRQSSPLEEFKSNKVYWKNLVGTGGCWFLYDVSYYGTAIFTPNILLSVFGKGDSLFSVAWQSLAVTAFGVPGCVAAVMLVKPWGCRKLSIVGFLLMAVCFGAMAVVNQLAPDNSALLFSIFCVIQFALNFGPNVSTFVLPTEVYPAHIRSTFYGVSSGMGKLGAVLGTFMYKPIADYSVTAVMWVQVGISLLGALVSVYYIDAEPSARYSQRKSQLGEGLVN